MKLYMDLGNAWDLAFRSFLVFIFIGLLWLKFVDPIISCSLGFPIPILIGFLYFYSGWNKARKDWRKEDQERKELERRTEVL